MGNTKLELHYTFL